jgi:GT2 family glycosyltransferase
MFSKDSRNRLFLNNTHKSSPNTLSVDINTQYREWIKNNYPTEELIDKQRVQSKKFKYIPKVTVIVPTYNTNHKHLIECIESVINQSYPNWELCIADDNSDDKKVRNTILQHTKKDTRIKYTFLKDSGHICKTSNEAIKLATGEFVGLLDHDDVLWPNALFEVVKRINNNPNSKFIYSDEDKIDEDGAHVDPFFKPDWSPEYLRSVNYITHFAVIKKELIQKVGGFRLGYEGAQDWDLFLRASESLMKNGNCHPLVRESAIQHIPTVLYSWRKSATSTASEKYAQKIKKYSHNNQQKALLSDARARKKNATVSQGQFMGIWDVNYTTKSNPLVSIIIPNKNCFELISTCIKSIISKSTYTNYEIVIVDTNSTSKKVVDFYKNLTANHKNISMLLWKKPFNYSAVNNFAVKNVRGEYIIFLNNDTEVISPNWIQHMLGYAQISHIGAVGAKLLYPNNEIQHAGVVLGIKGGSIDKGIAGHVFKHYKNGVDYGMINPCLYATRNYSAVTAACMMISKNKFVKLGGFDKRFRIAFNDVDLNLKLLSESLYNVYLPFVEMYHHESVSVGDPSEGTRDISEFQKEIQMMHDKWGDLLQRDPFYNQNLSLVDESFSVRLAKS